MVQGSDTNYYRAIKANKGDNPLTDGGVDMSGSWQLNHVFAPTALVVASGGRFAHIEDALAFARDAIVPRQLLYISVNGPLSYTLTEPINLNQSFGQNIQIVGSAGANSPVTITAPKGMNAFNLSNGNKFGGISNITVVGTPSSAVTSGFSITNDAALQGVDKVNVIGFSYGYFLSTGSKLYSTLGSVGGCNLAGVYVNDDSQAHCPGLTIDGDGSAAYGFLMSDKSQLSAQGSTVTDLSSTGIGLQESVDCASTITGSTITASLPLNIIGHSMTHAESCKLNSPLKTVVVVTLGGYANLFGSSVSPALNLSLALPSGVLTTTVATALGNDGSLILKP
jgi:hypothetical protein